MKSRVTIQAACMAIAILVSSSSTSCFVSKFWTRITPNTPSSLVKRVATAAVLAGFAWVSIQEGLEEEPDTSTLGGWIQWKLLGHPEDIKKAYIRTKSPDGTETFKKYVIKPRGLFGTTYQYVKDCSKAILPILLVGVTLYEFGEGFEHSLENIGLLDPL